MKFSSFHEFANLVQRHGRMLFPYKPNVCEVYCPMPMRGILIELLKTMWPLAKTVFRNNAVGTFCEMQTLNASVPHQPMNELTFP
jgi:hypothetical protein